VRYPLTTGKAQKDRLDNVLCVIRVADDPIGGSKHAVMMVKIDLRQRGGRGRILLAGNHGVLELLVIARSTMTFEYAGH
jgi:hypothetical protein